jgi:hypothetical protein
MDNNFTFHLFGDCWVEDPRQCLNDDEIAEISQYFPLFEELDRKWKNRMFSFSLRETKLRYK